MADIQRKTANWFDESDFGLVEVAAGTYRVGTDVGVLPSGKYTLNAVKSSSAIQIYRTTKNGSTYNYEAISELPYTFTADGVSSQIFRSAGNTGSSWVDFGYSDVMLNTGETAQTYEPYGWIHSLRKLGTATDTITSLPADIYADGTTATVGLKGNMSQTGTPTPQNPIQPSECGEMTGNLFDYKTAYASYLQPDGTIIGTAQQLAPISNSLANFVGQTVTISIYCSNVSATRLQITAKENGVIKLSNNVYRGNSGYLTLTITPALSTDYWAITYGNNGTNEILSQFMLNSGSTALPYEPYGYKLDISSGGKNLFDYDSYFDSVFTPYNEYFEYATIQLLPNTTYTLSTSLMEYGSSPRNTAFIVVTSNEVPTTARGGISNISPVTITTENDGILKLYKRISGSGIQPTKDLFDNGAWLMLNTGSTPLPYEPYNRTTTHVYLGEVETTRKIGKLVLTGEENISYIAVGGHSRFDFNNTYQTADYRIGVCSHYKYEYVNANNTVYHASTNTSFGLYIFDDNHTTAADFKSYLAAQYANGTPVTVWYVLATEETGIVNEPLRKIGDYADTVSGITVPTITGKDTFDVETTLKPSEVSLSYTDWHNAEVKEKSENLFDGEWVQGGININGNLVSSSERIRAFQTVQPNTTYTFSSTKYVRLIYGYNGDEKVGVIYDVDANLSQSITFTTQSECNRIGIAIAASTTVTGNITPSDISEVMLNTGSTALPYEPYWK